MGVSGLMSYCNDHRKAITDRVDLVPLARRHRKETESAGRPGSSQHFDPRQPPSHHPSPPLTILVDYYAFESFILPKFLLAKREQGGVYADPHFRIFGGEYGAYDSFVRRYLAAVRDLGISLVFFIDSSRGSSPNIAAHKLETWMERFRDTIEFFAEIRRVCYGKLEIQRLRDRIVRPCLLTVQTMLSIEEAGTVKAWSIS